MSDLKLNSQGQGLIAFSAENRLTWASINFGAAAVATTSCGADSAILLHLLSIWAPETSIYFIDTKFHFPETLAYKRQLESRLGLNIQTLSPADAPNASPMERGRLWETDPDACCRIHKSEVLEKALADSAIWITGLRREQSKIRGSIGLVEELAGGRVKFNPIFDWSAGDMERYFRNHDLPRHPLMDKGYSSIGCAPCTRCPIKADDPRSGRWAGQEKTECGIHFLYQKPKTQAT